ncbi:Predicted protein [Prochlorococcus marinus subsp. marinus str. CCMP1375]|uniref:Uncharacterized protein n=1 Tax=Prochlorococcus marinus (strain SARG / CCMP1375 / SS120) TaxID=167539 RepID=Q7VDM1_PROMA|nr:Predicted protein [Prochlorococcus marinus subsp. marinus str. CCMP1375]
MQLDPMIVKVLLSRRGRLCSAATTVDIPATLKNEFRTERKSVKMFFLPVI